MIVIQFILFIFLLFFVLLKLKMRKNVIFATKFPSDISTIPILGHMHLILKCKNDRERWNMYKMFCEQAIKKNGAICIWNLLTPYLCVSDPVIADCIIKNNNCLNKCEPFKLAFCICKYSVVSVDVQTWRPIRKQIMTNFSRKYLLQFQKVFSKQSMILVKQLQKVSGKRSVDIYDYITNYAMDSLCETTVGVEINVQENPEQKLKTAIIKTLELACERTTNPWHFIPPIYALTENARQSREQYNILASFLLNILSKKREQLSRINNNNNNTGDNDKEELKCLLDLMIESTSWNDKVILDETLSFFIAGSDTSALGIGIVCMLLARHPEAQEKLHKEIQDAFGNSNKEVSYEDLANLKYLDAVIKEALRLYPSIPIITRRTGSDIILPSGETIPKDMDVIISLYGIHHNPAYWGDDFEKFRPERFLEGPLKNPCAFIPFSSGPRNCIGYAYAFLSLKTVLINLLRHYRLLPNSKEELGQPIDVKIDLMLRSADGYKLVLDPLN